MVATGRSLLQTFDIGESLSQDWLWDFYRLGISIALLDQSLDLFAQLIPRWGLWFSVAWVAIHLRAAGAFKGWCAVRTLQT